MDNVVKMTQNPTEEVGVVKMCDTPEELQSYIIKNADKIYVREYVDQKWGSFSLTELPVKQAMKHAMRFIIEGRIPVVMKGEQNEQE